MADRMYVGTRKGLFVYERQAGGGWGIGETAFLGDPVSAVLPDSRDGRVYAAVGHGHFGAKLHRCEKLNEPWEECAAPQYPPRPDDASPDRCPNRNLEIPWNVELIWALEAGGAAEAGRLWCGTLPGGLFRSDDGGDSWQLNRPLWDDPARKAWFGGGYDYPGIHSICVDPRAAARVTVGVSCGGVWVSEDWGNSWNVRTEGMYADYMPPERRCDPHIQDPHRVVQCLADPDCLWAQHHNGVFASGDGGMTWRDITAVEPSNFGFAVAVDPTDGKTAWLVPAISDQHRIPASGAVVVARTRDGGESFEVLRSGLPQEHAYDLVFRHALDVDATGQVLAMGSTTGSLWFSNNRGDKWSAITNHLPPVHCVRFA